MKQRVGLKDFEMLREIGEGAFGTVMLGRSLRDGQLFAIKKVSKESLCSAG